MDYKYFIQELNSTKKELIDYINSTNKKNLIKIDKIVNEYLEEMKKGNYSIKSYKAKIIHNELEHSRTRREIMPLSDNVKNISCDLVSKYFEEYLEELNNLNIFSNKAKDMREFIQNNRRQKHDVLLKKNNTEKEFNSKTKEYELGKTELVSSFNDKISDLKIKLANNLKKSNDKTIKEFQEYETKLLDCDNKLEIISIKDNIKNVRLLGLDEEYNFKIETYQAILDEELKHNQDYFNYVQEFESYKKETQIKLAEYEKLNSELNLLNELRDNCYEYELRQNNLKLLISECENFVQKVINHNQKIINDYSFKDVTTDDKMFLFDIIEVNIYRLLFIVRKNNLYDPLINIIISLLESINSIKLSIKEVYDNINISSDDKKNKLLKELDNYIPESKKKTSKEDLIFNVINSLERYYNNFEIELDCFLRLIFDLFMQVVNKIITSHDNIKKLPTISSIASDSIISSTNYHFVDLTNYGYSNINNNVKINNSDLDEIVIKLDLSELVISDETNSYVSENGNDNHINDNHINDNHINIESHSNVENQIEENKIIEDDYQNSKYIDILNNLKSETENYCNDESIYADNKIKELNNNKLNKSVIIENNYKETVKEIEKKYKKLIEEINIEKIEKDKNIKKLSIKYLANAKKILSESKAML